MASILKVDTIQDQSGNNIINENADTITIGASGDTITVPTGATLTVPNGGLSGQNYPAFEAYLSTNQNVSDNVITKAQIDTEVLDTDNCYDNSTNYRFTPTVAGKYYIYGALQLAVNAVQIEFVNIEFKKNGTIFRRQEFNNDDDNMQTVTLPISAIVDFNGTSDYIELFGKIGHGTGQALFQSSGALTQNCFFGGYRLGD